VIRNNTRGKRDSRTNTDASHSSGMRLIPTPGSSDCSSPDHHTADSTNDMKPIQSKKTKTTSIAYHCLLLGPISIRNDGCIVTVTTRHGVMEMKRSGNMEQRKQRKKQRSTSHFIFMMVSSRGWPFSICSLDFKSLNLTAETPPRGL
jgi:hypothetical protein